MESWAIKYTPDLTPEIFNKLIKWCERKLLENPGKTWRRYTNKDDKDYEHFKQSNYFVFFGGDNSEFLCGIHNNNQFKTIIAVSELLSIIEPKLEPGKWYKNIGMNKDYIGKFKKIDENGNFVCEGGHVFNRKWETDTSQGRLTSDYKDAILCSIEEIQQYLPEGHVDKIGKLQREEVFPGIYPGDIVVSLVDKGYIRKNGELIKSLEISRKGLLWYPNDNGTTSDNANEWRKATPEEERAYNEGIRNIDDMNQSGLNIGDGVEAETLEKWVQKDLNYWDSRTSSWIKLDSSFIGDRKVIKFGNLNGHPAFQVSGTASNVWIKAAGFKEFQMSLKPDTKEDLNWCVKNNKSGSMIDCLRKFSKLNGGDWSGNSKDSFYGVKDGRLYCSTLSWGKVLEEDQFYKKLKILEVEKPESKVDSKHLLLEEARRRYPKGTKFKSLVYNNIWTSQGEPNFAKANEEDIADQDGFGNYLYKDGKWAEVINDKNIELIDEIKKRYPIGTKFRPTHLMGSTDLASVLTVFDYDQLEIAEDGDYISLYTSDKRNRGCYTGILRRKGIWAEIIELPNNPVSKVVSGPVTEKEEPSTLTGIKQKKELEASLINKAKELYYPGVVFHSTGGWEGCIVKEDHIFILENSSGDIKITTKKDDLVGRVYSGRGKRWAKITKYPDPINQQLNSGIFIDAEVSTIKIPLNSDSVTLKNTESEVKINAKQLNSIKIS